MSTNHTRLSSSPSPKKKGKAARTFRFSEEVENGERSPQDRKVSFGQFSKSSSSSRALLHEQQEARYTQGTDDNSTAPPVRHLSNGPARASSSLHKALSIENMSDGDKEVLNTDEHSPLLKHAPNESIRASSPLSQEFPETSAGAEMHEELEAQESFALLPSLPTSPIDTKVSSHQVVGIEVQRAKDDDQLEDNGTLSLIGRRPNSAIHASIQAEDYDREEDDENSPLLGHHSNGSLAQVQPKSPLLISNASNESRPPEPVNRAINLEGDVASNDNISIIQDDQVSPSSHQQARNDKRVKPRPQTDKTILNHLLECAQTWFGCCRARTWSRNGPSSASAIL